MAGNPYGVILRLVNKRWNKTLIKIRSHWVSNVCNSVGQNLKVFGAVKLHFPENLIIGNNCTLNHGVLINARGNVKIGNRVRISSNVTLETSYLDKAFADSEHRERMNGFIIIEDDVWIANGARILSNITIGKGSIIAAGAVVTKDVPKNSICAGVPGKSKPIANIT